MTSQETAKPAARTGLRIALAISVVVTALLFAGSDWAFRQIPEGTRIPIHWNLAGRPNGYGGRGFLYFIPCLSLGLALLFLLLPRVEPRRGRLLLSSPAYQSLWVATMIFLACVHAIMVRAALGHGFAGGRWVAFALGALFIVAGNALGHVESNFFCGIRTPWTLSSELSWRRTHRLGGWIVVLAGIGLAGAALADVPFRWLAKALFAFLIVLLPTVFVYSYRVWRADPAKGAPSFEEDGSPGDWYEI